MTITTQQLLKTQSTHIAVKLKVNLEKNMERVCAETNVLFPLFFQDKQSDSVQVVLLQFDEQVFSNFCFEQNYIDEFCISEAEREL